MLRGGDDGVVVLSNGFEGGHSGLRRCRAVGRLCLPHSHSVAQQAVAALMAPARLQPRLR